MKSLFISLLTLIAANAVAATNEYIHFLERVDAGEEMFAADLLKTWKMGSERAAVPESADFKNLDQMRLLIAANPDRYEAYMCYGRHFMVKHNDEKKAPDSNETDAAVLAFEKAEELIKKHKVKNPVDFSRFYSVALFMKYTYEREKDKRNALQYFDKIFVIDSQYFNRTPKASLAIASAVRDYVHIDDLMGATRLIEKARRISNLPSPVIDCLNEFETLIKNIEAQQKNPPDRK